MPFVINHVLYGRQLLGRYLVNHVAAAHNVSSSSISHLPQNLVGYFVLNRSGIPSSQAKT